MQYRKDKKIIKLSKIIIGYIELKCDKRLKLGKIYLEINFGWWGVKL